MIVQPIYFQQRKDLPPAMPIRVLIFDWILKSFISPDHHKSVIDLGCGPGLFARRYRNLGLSVRAVDARNDRIDLEEDFENIEFAQQDIRESALEGFDIISILGLFYHLTLEDQINLLNRIPKHTITIMETQIYVRDHVTKKGKSRLTPVSQSGFRGAIWQEPGNQVSTASWNNSESFWHGPKSLNKIFRQSGFKALILVEPKFMSIYASRGYFIGFK